MRIMPNISITGSAVALHCCKSSGHIYHPPIVEGPSSADDYLPHL